MSLRSKSLYLVATSLAVASVLGLACTKAAEPSSSQTATPIQVPVRTPTLEPTPTQTATTAPARPTNVSPAPNGDIAAGEKVFNAQGCGVCHQTKGSGGQIGPKLDGLYGAKVNLTTGGEVIGDNDYIRESIVQPGAKVKAGYQPIMPTSYTSISEQDLRNLISFIVSLK